MRSWSTWNNQDQRQHLAVDHNSCTRISSGTNNQPAAYYKQRRGSGVLLKKNYYQKNLQIKIVLFIFAKHFKTVSL
jgi:hypothetical protein